MEEEIESGTLECFLPGQKVRPGCYQEKKEREIGRLIILKESDYLPASLDGRVATYIKVEPFGLKQTT